MSLEELVANKYTKDAKQCDLFKSVPFSGNFSGDFRG